MFIHFAAGGTKHTIEEDAFDEEVFPKREFKLPWREAGPPNHHDDKVDADQ